MENHPLIKRQQTYLLDRKIVSVHSVDRDIKKWPKSNHFEVTLPEDIINIDSMRLVNINLPSNQYNFSNEYQNTKFIVSIVSNANGGSDPSTQIDNSQVLITINDGFYTPTFLVNEVENQLNAHFTEYIINNTTASSTYEYIHFRCKYVETTNKFVIGNDRDSFTLHFNEKIDYTIDCKQKVVWNNYDKWGFPSYIGFEKKEYVSNSAEENYGFYYDNSIDWLVVFSPSSSNNVYYYTSPLLLNVFGDNCIYMEVEKYNSMDELVPYVENTSATFNNDYSAITNSAFAKIPNISTPFSQIFDSRNSFLTNMKIFQTPLPKISKLRFTFRFHDGRLVDFGNMPFDFSLEFNQVRNIQMRNYLLQVPPTYNL